MSEEQQHNKVWNEDLVRALRARHQQAWQQQKQSQHQWRQGAEAVEKIRKDIRLTKTGKIFNLDAKQLTKTCDPCQRCKNQFQEHGKLPPRIANDVPWSDIAVDLTGPWTIGTQDGMDES